MICIRAPCQYSPGTRTVVKVVKHEVYAASPAAGEAGAVLCTKMQ